MGLGLFCLPGMSLFHLLSQGRSKSPFGYLTIGFAVSNGMVGCVGLIARALHLPFETILISLFIMCAICWILVFVQWQHRGGALPNVSSWIQPIELLFLLLMIIVIGLALRYPLSRTSWVSDDNRYGAYLINWQRSEHLDFDDVILDIESPINVRFWLAHFPLSEGVFSDLSGLHSVEWIGIYLEPLLIVLALLAVYELGQALGLPSRWSVLAVLVQALILLYLSNGQKWERAGIVFFYRLSLDKSVVAFLLGPIFLRLLIDFYQQTTWKSFILLLIAGLSMMFTHPTLMGATILVAGVYACLELVTQRQNRAFLAIAVLSGLLAAFPLSLRFFTNASDRVYSAESAAEISQDKKWADALYFVADGRFYGADARILLADPRGLPDAVEPAFQFVIWGVIAVAGVVALLQVRQSVIARFILAADAVLFVTIVPYTGWIIGYFMSAYHLIRVPWIFPFGIAAAYVVYSSYLLAASKSGSRQVYYGLVGLELFVVLLGFSAAILDPIRAVSGWQQRFTNLVELGKAFDAHQPQPATVIGIPLDFNDQLPSLSPSAKLLMMTHIDRTMIHGASEEKATARFEAWELITNPETPADKRLALLNQYHVQYIFVQRKQATQWITRVAQEQPEHYQVVDQKGNYTLYQVVS
jgi:hypothetical protein